MPFLGYEIQYNLFLNKFTEKWVTEWNDENYLFDDFGYKSTTEISGTS